MRKEKSIAPREQSQIQPMEPWETVRDMERAMRDFFLSPFPSMRAPLRMFEEMRSRYMPEVDLKETEKEYQLEANIPGIEPDDIDINVTKDSISITGERKLEESKPGESYHIRQRSYGTFSVSYNLPSNVKPDEVKATHKNGILTVIMPKAEVTEAHKVTVEKQG